jgi:hypothetical protein
MIDFSLAVSWEGIEQRRSRIEVWVRGVCDSVVG